MTQLFIYLGNNTVREKGTMEKPLMDNKFMEVCDCHDCTKYRNYRKAYEDHIESLPRYTFINNSGRKPGLDEEVMGEFGWQWQDSHGLHNSWNDCSKEYYETHSPMCRRIVVRSVSKPENNSDEKLHSQLYPEVANKPEYIICSAIWFKDGKKHEHQPKNIDTGFVVCGRRHHNCFITKSLLQEFSEAKKTADQGFLTSKDRFVDRKEAATIAFERGQSKKKNILFSEDLY